MRTARTGLARRPDVARAGITGKVNNPAVGHLLLWNCRAAKDSLTLVAYENNKVHASAISGYTCKVLALAVRAIGFHKYLLSCKTD